MKDSTVTSAGLRKVTTRIGPSVVLALLVVYLVWGTTYYAMRVALHGYTPFFLCAIRFLLAGTILFAYTLATGNMRINRRLLLDALATGFFLATLGNGLVVSAEQHVSSGIAALALSIESVFILLLAFLFYGRRIRRWQFAGSFLCFSGVVSLVAGTELRYSPAALAALLGAALAWAIGSIWSAQRESSGSTLTFVALQMLWGGAIAFAIAAFSKERLGLSNSVDANLAALYLTLFGSIATFVSYNYLLRRVSPSLAISYAYVNPAIAFVAGCLFDKDQFRPTTAVSLAGILAGVWLIVRHEVSSPASLTVNSPELGTPTE